MYDFKKQPFSQQSFCDNIHSYTCLMIVFLISLIFQIEHDTTALVWEWLPVKVNLTNMETSLASDISLSFGLDPSSHTNLEHTSKFI